MFITEKSKLEVTNGTNDYEVVMTMDVNVYYSIINSLRESCGCEDCKLIANRMIISRGN